MQLQTMNTRPFSTQRDNLVLTRKRRAKGEEKAHAIENPQDGERKGGKLRRGGEGGDSWVLADAGDKLHLV